MFSRGTKRIYLIMTAILVLLMTLIPAIAIVPKPETGGKSSAPAGRKFGKNEYFRVLISSTGEVERVPYGDYLIGTVAAEMGPDAPVEALKAQTVASFTFALYRRGENSGADYDVTDSADTDQRYLSDAELRSKWGENYEKYRSAVEKAVSEAAGYVLTDGDSKPILAVYHSVSAGRTESAGVVWGRDYPYLQPVESIGDLLSPDYLSIRKFTPAELKRKLADEVTLEGEPSGWIKGTDCSDSGTVKALSLGDGTVSGDRVRALLGLRSAAFDVSYSDEDGFVFNVKGWGHGVGMSQYGACYLAETGSTFIEILSHYYTGCSMKML